MKCGKLNKVVKNTVKTVSALGDKPFQQLRIGAVGHLSKEIVNIPLEQLQTSIS